MRKCRAKQCRLPLPTKKASTPIQAAGFCSYDCATKHGLHLASTNREKVTKAKKTEARKDLRDLNRRKISWQHDQCQPVFNRLRVQEELQWFADRGLDPECISCGKTNMDWCCGHLKTVGAQSGLRYDPRNTFLQCNMYCNQSLSGNLTGNKNTRGYTQGLADRFGAVEAQRIIDYCETKTAAVKWDWQEMEAWRKEWNQQIREIQKVRMAA
jgi:hypothetical protein